MIVPVKHNCILKDSCCFTELDRPLSLRSLVVTGFEVPLAYLDISRPYYVCTSPHEIGYIPLTNKCLNS